MEAERTVRGGAVSAVEVRDSVSKRLEVETERSVDPLCVILDFSTFCSVIVLLFSVLQLSKIVIYIQISEFFY